MVQFNLILHSFPKIAYKYEKLQIKMTATSTSLDSVLLMIL